MNIPSSWWLNHPFEKYDRQNGWKSVPNFRGENSKNLWNHHLGILKGGGDSRDSPNLP